jgi:hypothetical protein
MLTTFLPGIRDVRTPLTVGYAWLIAAWLAFAHDLPSRSTANVYAEVLDALRRISPVTVGVIASVAAYLVGVVAVAITLRVTSELGTLLRRTPLDRLTPRRRSTSRLRPVLERLVLRRLRIRLATDPVFRAEVLSPSDDEPPARPSVLRPRKRREWKSAETLRRLRATVDPQRYLAIEQQRVLFRGVIRIDPLVDGMVAELDSIALRFRSTHYTIYDEYDRLQSEADFRVAIFPPVVTLFMTLGVRWNLFWCVGALVAVALLYVGAGARAKAGAVVVNALIALDIDDPALERVDTGGLDFVDEVSTLDVSLRSPALTPGQPTT